MKDIRAAKVDIRSSEMNFHIHVVRCCSRIHIQDRFVVRVSTNQLMLFAATVLAAPTSPCTLVSARDGREIDMIQIMSEIGDCVEVAGARLRIRDRFEHESIVAATTRHRVATAVTDENVVFEPPISVSALPLPMKTKELCVAR